MSNDPVNTHKWIDKLVISGFADKRRERYSRRCVFLLSALMLVQLGQVGCKKSPGEAGKEWGWRMATRELTNIAKRHDSAAARELAEKALSQLRDHAYDTSPILFAAGLFRDGSGGLNLAIVRFDADQDLRQTLVVPRRCVRAGDSD